MTRNRMTMVFIGLHALVGMVTREGVVDLLDKETSEDDEMI